ncbi:MAG: DNA polymerase III subunit beta [Phycisphaerae bacterium]|nr:DNA polymerase III subunit beta [Phycisphaerae bacterium]
MKVDFNRSALSEALVLLTSVVPTRTPKPILRCVKITADGDSVYMCATDLEVGIKIEVSEAVVKEPGEVVVSADKFAAIVRESFEDVLSIETNAESCIIRGSDSLFNIYSQDPGQYPAVGGLEGEADIEVNLKNLQRGIEESVFATAKESTRYALNGILCQMSGKKLVLVATDGRRLARTKVNLIEAAKENLKDAKIIIPSKTMSLLDKVGGTQEDVVAIKFGDNQISLKCGNVVISSNLVEGNFPKYEDIIPSDYSKKITLSSDAVMSAVKRSALVTSEESRGIKLSIEKNKIVFSCRSPEAGDSKVEMAADYTGDKIEIGFNPQFLVDVLRVIDTEQFDLELGDADRPGLIKSGKDFLYVLMPISLN